MLDKLSGLLVLLLIVCLSHLPIPLGHTHADLDGHWLAQHLRQYHCTAAESEVPQGWHLHLLMPALGSSGDGQGELTAINSEIRPELGTDLRCPTGEIEEAPAGSERVDVKHRIASGRIAPARAVEQRYLYKRLSVLLI